MTESVERINDYLDMLGRYYQSGEFDYDTSCDLYDAMVGILYAVLYR